MRFLSRKQLLNDSTRSAGNPYPREFRNLLRTAWPLVLAQLAQNSLSFVDTMMAGRLGTGSLAGIALGGTVFFFVVFILSGMILAVGPIVSQTLGAEKLATATAATQQGLWLSLFLTPVAFLIFRTVTPMLLGIGQEPETARLANGYLNAISWGLFPAFGLFALRGFLEGRSDTTSIMVICFIGVGLNIFANNVLMFGKFGLPALGIVGTGYASTIVFTAMFLMMATWIAIRHSSFDIFRWQGPNAKMLGEIFRVGTPIGLSIGFEIGLFSLVALMMGTLGEAQLAAHQIAIQTCSITFMVPLGIGIAASVRVGHAIGRNLLDQAAVAGYTGMMASVTFMCFTAIIFWFFPRQIISLYIDDPGAKESIEVARLAIAFLGVAAVFQIFDGLQVASSFALRAIKDTTAAMVISMFSYWVIGFGSSLMFCYGFGLGAIGLWYGMIVALSTAAVFLTLRFWWMVRRAHR